MTYEEIVEKVRRQYEYADARSIYDHVAVQVNLTGEVEGCFYIEVAERKICVEPYDYYDKDALVTIDTSTILSIIDRDMKQSDAFKRGLIDINGDVDKVSLLRKIKFQKK